jgi:hypothetical protein
VRWIPLFAVLLLACGSIPVAITPTVAPTVTPTIKPTFTPVPTKTKSPCLQWNEVYRYMVDEELCVYGKIYIAFSVNDDSGNELFSVIRFSEESNKFYIVQKVVPMQFEMGECLSVSGKLQVDDTGIPFIEDGQITKCQ